MNRKDSEKRIFLKTIVPLLILLALIPFAYADEAFILLNEKSSLQDAVKLIEDYGGKATHRFSDVIIGDIPKDAYENLTKSGLIDSIDYGFADDDKLKQRGKTSNIMAEVWNKKVSEKGKPEEKSPHEGLSWGDPRFGREKVMENPAKEKIRKEKEEAVSSIAYSPGAGAGSPGSPAPPQPPPYTSYYETSEYLIGDVSVGIIFVESNGSIDSNSEDWTGTEETNVINEIQAGLNWLASQEPNAQVSWTYDINYKIPTDYEPITRSSSSDDLWISETLRFLGYSQPSWSERVYAYLNNLRNNDNTDWAYVIFVVDDANDADKKFTDGYFAYAYLGGPLLVMTYNNDGWGIGNMDKVSAHETHHIFGAADEYCQPGYSCCFCGGSVGYLNVGNDNCEAGCPEGSCDGGEPDCNDCGACYTSNCIMESNAWCQTQSTKYQIGWRDSDNDGVLAPIDCDDNNYNVYPLTSSSQQINRDTTLCEFAYNFANGPVIASNDITLDCNNALINGTFGFGQGIRVASRYNVIIKNCNVQYFVYGVNVYNSENIVIDNTTAKNNSWKGFNIANLSYGTVKNSRALNNSGLEGYGFSLEGTNNVLLVNNYASGSKFGGYRLWNSYNNNLTKNNAVNDGFEIWDSFNNTLEENYATECFEGFYILRSTFNRLINNKAVNNDYKYGFRLVSAANNTFIGNNASNNEDGFMIEDSNNNSFINNYATGSSDEGFYLDNSSNNNLIGNIVKNNSDRGILLYSFSSNNTLRDNIITNNLNGIRLWSSGNNTITENNITNNKYGIYFVTTTNNKIEFNNIYNNNIYVVYNDQANNVTAENNWWGTTNTTKMINSIYDYYDDNTKGVVDYCPLLNASYPGGASAICCINLDGDGYSITGGDCGAVDCNDANASINPGATEICNLIDDNCDGLIDEDACIIPCNYVGSEQMIDGDLYYCNINHTLNPQKQDGQACYNNFECLNNYCGFNVCVNTVSIMKQIDSILDQIIGLIP